MDKKNIYYHNKISLGSVIALLIVVIVLSFSSGLIIMALFGFLSGVLPGFIVFLMLSLFLSQRIITVELSDVGLEVKYPFSLWKKKMNIDYSLVLCAYFYRGLHLSGPSIFIKFKNKNETGKISFEVSSPSTTLSILKDLSNCGVKTGVSENSFGYIGVTDKLKIIQID